MTRLLSIAIGLGFASFCINGMAQANAPMKADNDPFKYPVYEGRMACDDNVFVVVIEDKKIRNNFDVLVGKAHYKTKRIPTDSGAIRLEAKAQSIVWLQMANKSMLLNEKAGKRLANNCRNETQKAAETALLAMPDTTTLGKQ
jgi:hypothetical protein